MNETLRVTTLANGLRVATDTMSDSGVAAVGVWTNCGTRHEAPEVNGVAHMLEHMLFKGTERRSAQAIAEEMEAVGGNMNAYTGRENTAYYARVLKEDAGLTLEILADILQRSVFDESDLGRERHVVLQELGQAMDTPDDIVFDYFHEAALPGQPAGRSILGTAQSVTGMTRAALTGYIGRHYVPSHMVVAGAGGVDHDWLVAETERLFTSLPQTPPPGCEPARYAGGDFRLDADLEQVHLILGFEGIGLNDPDYHAAQLFSVALGGGMSSRLFQEIRERRGLVYSIHSFGSDFVDTALFGIYAGTGAEQLNELVPVLCREITAARGGISEAELARAKAQSRASLLMGLENSFNRAETLALNLLTYARPIPAAETLARIASVSLEDIARVSRRILGSRPTVTALGPLARLESYDRIAGRIAA